MYSVELISCTCMCGVSTSVLLVTKPQEKFHLHNAISGLCTISNTKTPEHHFSLTTLGNTVCMYISLALLTNTISKNFISQELLGSVTKLVNFLAGCHSLFSFLANRL